MSITDWNRIKSEHSYLIETENIKGVRHFLYILKTHLRINKKSFDENHIELVHMLYSVVSDRPTFINEMLQYNREKGNEKLCNLMLKIYDTYNTRI